MLYRIATMAGIKSACRREALPPCIKALPLYFPLSRLKGATPARAADPRRPSVPSSGARATTFAAVSAPTPSIPASVPVRPSSRSSPLTVSAIWRSRSRISPLLMRIAFSTCFFAPASVRLSSVPESWTTFFVSASRASTSWRMRRSLAPGACDGAGFLVYAKWRMTEASMGSVLADRDMAFAKCRTLAGFRRLARIPALQHASNSGAP